MAKKGSLSLSVNAIVVLVLALTMLGVGIAFTKNMLGNLSKGIGIPPQPVPKASVADPIQITNEGLIKCAVGEDCFFSLSVYNTADNDGEVTIEGGTCKGKIGSETVDNVDISKLMIFADSVSAPARTPVKLNFALNRQNSGGVLLCSINLKNSDGVSIGTAQVNVNFT